MKEFATSAVNLADWSIDSDNSESEQERQWWEVVVSPPEEYDDDPREVAERLYADLHAHGQLSFEIHSDGPDIALKVVAPDRPTAETVARHVRSEIGAQTDIQEASVPISSDDPIAAAEFEISKDVIFPLETVRTTDSDCGQLHHLLDTFAADDIRGVYQVSVEPVEGDWTARRSRALPESIPQEQDPEAELKRAGLAMVPVFALSFVLSPWPVGTSLIVALGLVMAATIGEGVSIPEYRTAGEIARQHRERMQERHGAQSSVTKQAKQTADEIIEQAGSFGWKASIRLVVSHDENRMVAADIRDSLVAEIESAFSSETTGQELTATPSTGEEAREVLDHVRTRHLGDRSTAEIARRMLGKGTRRELHVGPGEFAVLSYFPGASGGGGDSREFATESADIEAMDVPDAAPTYTRSPAIADGGTTAESEFHVDPDEIETRHHPDFGEVEVQIIELRPDKDNDDHYAGEFCREWVESSAEDSLIWVGYSEEDEQIREIGVPISQLRRPSFIAGASGAGKSTLAEIIALQHIWGGRGCAIVDPHNDFVDELKTKIPEHRRDDVIEIDPGNLQSEYTHTINFLDVEVSEDHPDYAEAVDEAIEDAIGVISQGASNIGDRMEDVLHGVTRGMIVSEKDYTFLDMRDVLRYEDEREEFAAQMAHEGHEYIAEFAVDLTEMSNEDLAPVNRLLNKWVLSETAREIISHTDTSIDFRKAIEEDKIILVRNDLSDSIQRLVATAIFSKIWRAARQRPRGERPLFPVIMDEIDDIHTDEMALASKLGNARKYGIGLTLMTQKPLELDDITEDIKTNCKLFVAFSCPSDKQARPVAKMFDCDLARVTQLGDYRSLIQLDVDGVRKGPLTAEMLAPIPSILTDDEVAQEITIPSRQNYGLRRDRVSDASELAEGDDEDADLLGEFLAAAAEAASSGVIEQGEQFTHVHAGSASERLRINPSKTIEAIEEADREISVSLDEVRDHAREAVDDDSSPVTGYRQNTPPAGRCVGIDLNRVYSVDAGELSAQ
jgi:hypothetical protein